MEQNSTAVTKLDFSTSPTVAKFMKSKGFVRGLLGPVGSGKSYACCAELWRRAVQQKALAQGWYQVFKICDSPKYTSDVKNDHIKDLA